MPDVPWARHPHIKDCPEVVPNSSSNITFNMPAIPPLVQGASPAISTLPIRKHKFDTPKLRLQLNDLVHEGSSIFLSNIKGGEDFETQVQNVLNLLYTPDSHRPGTRSVTLILREMDGVAYTTGIDLDDNHKVSY